MLEQKTKSGCCGMSNHHRLVNQIHVKDICCQSSSDSPTTADLSPAAAFLGGMNGGPDSMMKELAVATEISKTPERHGKIIITLTVIR